MKVMYGKPELVSSRCKTLWSFSMQALRATTGWRSLNRPRNHMKLIVFLQFNFGSCT